MRDDAFRAHFIEDERGVAAVELALLMPVAIFMLAMAVFGGEGLGIQRKVTLAARTITDLVGQTSTSSSANSSGIVTLNQSTLDYYISLASIIVYPYDPSALTAELSEIYINPNLTTGCSGSNPPTTVAGVVQWSEGYNGGSARAKNSTVAISGNVACAGAPYMLLGETQYSYTPVGVANVTGPFNITGQIFMIPRSASQININWGS